MDNTFEFHLSEEEVGLVTHLLRQEANALLDVERKVTDLASIPVKVLLVKMLEVFHRQKQEQVRFKERVVDIGTSYSELSKEVQNSGPEDDDFFDNGA